MKLIVRKEKELLLESSLLNKWFNNRYSSIFICMFLLFSLNLIVWGQDTTKSQAIKPQEIFLNKSLVKAKYPPYPLMAGFLLVKEANGGDPFAQHELGIRYILGNGFPADTVLGISWLKKAVQANIPAAHFNYAIMCANGTGVEWNPFAAYIHFKYAAQAGLPEGEYMYGVTFIDNFVVSRNIATAFYWLKKAEKDGFQPAKELINELIKSGYSAPPDSVIPIEETIEPIVNHQSTILDPGLEPEFFKFEKDSTDHTDKQNFVNMISDKNINEIKEFIGSKIDTADISVDSLKALALIDSAVIYCSPEAIFIKANQTTNYIRAVELYLAALRNGYNQAFYSLNKIITKKEFKDVLTKLVNKKDAAGLYIASTLRLSNLIYDLTFDQAIEYLKTSAIKKNNNALNELGLAYYSGKFVDKDKDEAIKLWQTAASFNDNEAIQRLIFTKMVDGYSEVTNNDIKYLQKAVDWGSILGLAALGFAYEKGIFVPTKMAVAVQYYRRGAHRGNYYAYTLLKRLYDELRPEYDEFTIYTDE